MNECENEEIRDDQPVIAHGLLLLKDLATQIADGRVVGKVVVVVGRVVAVAIHHGLVSALVNEQVVLFAEAPVTHPTLEGLASGSGGSPDPGQRPGLGVKRVDGKHDDHFHSRLVYLSITLAG